MKIAGLAKRVTAPVQTIRRHWRHYNEVCEASQEVAKLRVVFDDEISAVQKWSAADNIATLMARQADILDASPPARFLASLGPTSQIRHRAADWKAEAEGLWRRIQANRQTYGTFDAPQ